MRNCKEEPSCSTMKAVDLISAVKELHALNSQDLSKVIRDSDYCMEIYVHEKGTTIKVDMEKFAGLLPLHLIAVLISAEKDEATLKYLLSGLRLLHSLCDLAPGHAKLEQILFDDVKISEQLLDLAFYLLIVLCGVKQGKHDSSSMLLLHSALVAFSFHTLSASITSQWQDLVHVLLAHPKVDIFMDVAFRSVCEVMGSLQIKLLARYSDLGVDSSSTAEQTIKYLCQQCEASLQFLHSLCQQKAFRERILRNKELCGKGGVLFLARTVLSLEIPPSSKAPPVIVAAVSRMKAKVLSILLHLCEAETVSYLDEVASCQPSLDLAKSVVLEVLNLLKTALSTNAGLHGDLSARANPMGLLQLNAMRLADVFSDDSNFRSYITTHFTEALAAMFSLSHGDFTLCWCSSDLPVREEDASLKYDPYSAAGWVLNTYPSLDARKAASLEYIFITNNVPQASYAHQRTSLFVKIIANLHCFIPIICQEQERNSFLLKFLECLQIGIAQTYPALSGASDMEKADTVCKNMRSLLSHAESLIPTFLNEEDVHYLRVFLNQLESSTKSVVCKENGVQDAQIGRGCLNSLLNYDSSSNPKEGISDNSASQELAQFYVKSKHTKEGDDSVRQDGRQNGKFGVSKEPERDTQNVETSGSDSSSMKGKHLIDRMENDDASKLRKHGKPSGSSKVQDDEKVETAHSEEKLRKKRKRTIMNDEQIAIMERALVDEPEMQRNATLIQTWADKLSFHGSEVTTAQLKNWLNNRKARLARLAKDVRAPPDTENALSDKKGKAGQGLHDSTEDEEIIIPSSSRANPRSASRNNTNTEKSESAQAEIADVTRINSRRCEPGQHIVLMNEQGEEIGKGKVHQVSGKWYGRNLDELQVCVVDVSELKAPKWYRVPYPSETTGNSFQEAEAKMGVIRVLWDSSKIFMQRLQ